jgi:hypothetical protein
MTNERRFIVRTRHLPIVAGILSAIVLAGCGGEEPTKVDMSGKADTSKFGGMMDQMKANVKADKSGKPKL